jgi:hypothetical protein
MPLYSGPQFRTPSHAYLTPCSAARQIPCMTFSLRLTGDSILQRRLNSRDDAELKPLFDKVRAADVAFTNREGLANYYRA